MLGDGHKRLFGRLRVAGRFWIALCISGLLVQSSYSEVFPNSGKCRDCIAQHNKDLRAEKKTTKCACHIKDQDRATDVP